MRKITVFLLLVFICATLLFESVGKNKLVGTWENDNGKLVFESYGQCLIGEKTGFYRMFDKRVDVLFDDGERMSFSYMLLFDEETLYFDGKNYKKFTRICSA